MSKEFVASNGLSVRETPGTLAITVDNLYIGEAQYEALHEYFSAVLKGTFQ